MSCYGRPLEHMLTDFKSSGSGRSHRRLCQSPKSQCVSARSYRMLYISNETKIQPTDQLIAPRHMCEKLRLSIPSSDQHQGISERARATVPRAPTATAYKGSVEGSGGNRRVAADDMPDFEVQGGFRFHPRHASIIELQRVCVS